MTRSKLKLGDTVIVATDPRGNNGADEAPAVVTRVLNVEGEDRVNLRVHLDGEGTLVLRNVLVESSRPSEKTTNDAGDEVVAPLPKNVAWRV